MLLMERKKAVKKKKKYNQVLADFQHCNIRILADLELYLRSQKVLVQCC